MPFSQSSPSAIRRLAVAQAISFAGGTSAYVALTSAIYARTGSAVWVAAVAAVSFALPSLISPIAGALGDRYDRRAVMVYSDLLGTVCFVALAFCSAPLALLGVKAVAAIVAAPFLPAAAAAVPRMVPSKQLPHANSTVTAWGTAGTLVGPLLGGSGAALVGASWVFTANAISFAISALLVATLRGNFKPSGDRHREHRGLGAGLRFLVRDPLLRPITIGVALLFVGIGMTLPAEIVRAREFGVGANGYGLMIAVWAAGGLAGAQLAGRLLRSRTAASTLPIATAGLIAGFVLAGVAPWFGALLLGLVAGGLAEGVVEVAHQLLLQRRTPDQVLSRAFAGNTAVEQLALSVPLLYSGLLVNALGAGAVYCLAAGVCAVGLLFLVKLAFLR
jgi:MFS family permease